MNKKVLLMFLVFALGYTRVMGQSINKEFDKMIFLFIDEKYEKCANMGIKFTEDDELRKDPIPYLYVSMSMFEISKDRTLDEKHPDAFKNALKYAYKYRKKDDKGIYLEKYEGFLTALKDSANKLGQYWLQQEQYRKASSTYLNIVRFDPDDPIMQLWEGISEIKAKNVGEGERNMTLAMEKIDDNFLPDKVVLWVSSKGMEEYAAYMEYKGDYAGKRKGQKMAEKFKKYSPEEIERQKKLEAEKNKPKREVKSFETDDNAVKNQKPKIIGTNENADDVKKELERIEQEQKESKQPKRQTKTFESDN